MNVQVENKKIFLPNSYAVIDLEMTGLSNKTDKIIEVSILDVEDGKIVNKYNHLVNPNVKLSQEIINLTGIDDDMLINMPFIDDIIDEIYELLKDKIWLGHNVAIDYGFIKKALVNKYGKSKINEYIFRSIIAIDTLKISRSILEKDKSKKLYDICRYFNIDIDISHRAYNDCVYTHIIYQKFRDLIIKNNYQSDDYFTKEIFISTKQEKIISKTQKVHLKKLYSYYKIKNDINIDKMTKSEASRLIDSIQSTYGVLKFK